jgi:transposase
MARRGRPTVQITLSGDEHKTLQRWARRHSSSQALALRCRIVLGAAEGHTNEQIAAELGCHATTVSKWRHRFALDRLDGLGDAPRPGAARKISDETVEAIVVDALETTPPDATHWSTRTLAAKHGISNERVAAIWRAFGLKPWLPDEFKISPDPLLVEKIRDLVALYMNPPVAAAVFAIDEKPQIQALNRTAPILPMLPTTPARATHDYQRHGTCDLFAALEIATGKVITDIRPRHTSTDFVAFLNKVNRNVPASLDIHVILDNLATHKTPTVQRWLLRHRRFHFHFTPTYGSWIEVAPV